MYDADTASLRAISAACMCSHEGLSQSAQMHTYAMLIGRIDSFALKMQPESFRSANVEVRTQAGQGNKFDLR